MVQTVPPSSAPVCPGRRLVFTCTGNINAFVWKLLGNSTETHLTSNSAPVTVGSFYVTAAAANNGLFISTATNEPVPVQLNGTKIECSADAGLSYAALTINVKGNLLFLL